MKIPEGSRPTGALGCQVLDGRTRAPTPARVLEALTFEQTAESTAEVPPSVGYRSRVPMDAM
jgi:hypothetical protein